MQTWMGLVLALTRQNAIITAGALVELSRERIASHLGFKSWRHVVVKMENKELTRNDVEKAALATLGYTSTVWSDLGQFYGARSVGAHIDPNNITRKDIVDAITLLPQQEFGRFVPSLQTSLKALINIGDLRRRPWFLYCHEQSVGNEPLLL